MTGTLQIDSYRKNIVFLLEIFIKTLKKDKAHIAAMQDSDTKIN
jgi:hypothetical protein